MVSQIMHFVSLMFAINGDYLVSLMMSLINHSVSTIVSKSEHLASHTHL
jgi:hypothetical protein